MLTDESKVMSIIVDSGPEAEVVLLRLESDLLDIIDGIMDESWIYGYKMER